MKAIFIFLSMTAMASWGADTSVDQGFWFKAAEGSTGEIQLGQLAQEKGTSSEVKELGAMMVKDHSAAHESLRAVVAKKQLELPLMPATEQIVEIAKLKNLEGSSFDKEYVRSVIEQHKEALRLFDQEVQSGQDSDLRAFASATLPILKTHLQTAQAAANKLHLKLQR